MGIVTLIVLKICVLLFNNAHAVYFTVSDLELNLPGDLTKFPPGNWPLATFHALSERRDKQPHIRYGLPDKDEHLQIFPSTGDVMFRNITALRDVYNITVSAIDKSGERNVTTIKVVISPTRTPLDCDLILPDLCYWQSANYKILENTDPTTLGTLSSPYLLEMCRGFKLRYSLITHKKNDNRLELLPPQESNNQWTLRTTHKLERDVIKFLNNYKQNFKTNGSFINIGVNCHVQDPKGTVYDKVVRNFTVEVMDEDDNLPVSQYDEDVAIILDNVIKKGDEIELQHKKNKQGLLLIDRDSPAANNYKFEIIGDSLRLFKPSCEIFDEYTHDESQTVIHCILIAKRSKEIGDERFRMFLQINDTTYHPGTDSRRSWIRVPIDVRTKLSGNSSELEMSEEPAPLLKPMLLYPDSHVSLFRSAAPFARITQPKEKLKKNSNFVLVNGSSGGFNVTESEGILYVGDIELLRRTSSPCRVTIQWNHGGELQSDDLEVRIYDDPSNSCKNLTGDYYDWTHCAKFTRAKKCESACAVATGGAYSVELRTIGGPQRCMWRGDRHPGGDFTRFYSTCTPDNRTCPDAVCDSLESLHTLICPQDCSESIMLGAERNEKTRKGVIAGHGVCHCDEFTNCVCSIPITKKKPNHNHENTTTLGNEVYANFSSPPPNLSPHIGPEIATCGKGCLLGVMAGGVFLLGAVAASVACWRFYRVHMVRGKFAAENNGVTAPLSEYVGGGAMHENTLNLNFDMTTSLSQQNQHKMAPDPKWEFPRNQLIIEQTLGEGEFGRVLRARAKDISGQQGYTIVAVKTLKDDARESELADLLSEYQLLKEVSHPNIIKLLGASTMPGGPVYLIIEFAQHGSLRSYLRRSRHLKSESQIPFSASFEENSGAITSGDSNYDKPRNCKVTPVDILSFAWQISNGMAYLSEIKLVHRDLAARNVLLTAEKICKISDFGLTRDIYEEDAYFKRSKGRVPVKWMAPESLSDHVYTSKTDVWSFGILVWELVTLGATPYPGIQVQNLFHLIKTGYRMERPDNCSPSLYKIMRSCWHIDHEQRPSFQELTERWEKMLGDQVEYLDLTPNAIHNRSYFCTLDENEEDENDNNENFDNEEEEIMIPEENLATNKDYPKCGDSDKLLEEPKPTNKPEGLQLSPLAQGYETPVKTQFRKAQTPSNEAPEYYTNMEAALKK